MDAWDIFPRQAATVGLKAIEEGLARHALTSEALFQKAAAVIKRARDGTHALMEKGIIPITV